MDKKTIGIIAIVVIASVFGIYSATAKNKTETITGGGSTSTGGVGTSILSGACAALGIKC